MMEVATTVQETIINFHDSSTEVSCVSDTHCLQSRVVEGSESNMVVGTHPGEKVPPAGEVETSAGLKRAQGLIRGLCLVLDHHDCPSAVMNSFKTQATSYLDCESELVFFKRAKYLTVAPMARYLKCEAPKVPDLAWKPVGQYRDWANTRLRVFCRKNTHLWYSFLQGKRSALPLSDELVLTTYEEHRKAMEIEDPIDELTLKSVMKELMPVLDAIRKRLQQVYDTSGREADWLLPREAKHVASTRASFEKSRADGGQLGALMRTVPRLYECNPLNPVRRRCDPDLVRMTFFPRAIVSGRVQLNVVIEEYGYPDGEKQWYEAIRKSCVYFASEQRTLKATIQAVLEPLKVRVISKGNAGPYYISKRLQKALHGVMRDMDCFRLIGQPLGATDLMDLALNPVQTGTGQLEWFSIDYSAATDRLSARLSASILDYLVQGQDDAMKNVWKAVLAPHFCKYPFPYSDQVRPVQQRNGQLMGSILSFPILCLANLGLYLETIKEDQRPLDAKLKGVLVNGDDMLYVAPRSLWEVHVENGTKVGLSMSPGKAYHHPVYANANSACYHFDLRRLKTVEHRRLTGMRRVSGIPTPVWSVSRSFAPKSSTPYSIPFLNSGLYFGQNKVMGGDDVDNEKSFCSVINRLVDGSLPGKQADLLSMYLNRHRSAIEEECAGRNLFIPIPQGGMGVQPVDGFKFRISLAQKMYAQEAIEDMPFAHWQQLPCEEKHYGTIPEAPQPLSAPWLAGLYFDEEGSVGEICERPKFTIADRIKRFKRGIERDFFQKKAVGSDRLLFPLRISASKREGVPYLQRIPEPNMFYRRSQRDRLLSYFLDSEEETLEPQAVPVC